MATALFMAAALLAAQAEATAPSPRWGASQTGAPAPDTQASAPAWPAWGAAQAPASAPVPASVVSTAAQEDLDSPPTVRPFEMPASALRLAARDTPADAPATAPVKVEAYHRSYEGPPDAEEAYYDAGVESAFQAEQALRGPLEGMWTVSAADGAPLLSLVISDPGRPGDPPGGAWRDLSPARDPDASGLIDQVVEDGPVVIVQIRRKPGAPPTTLRLTASADGRWRGLLLDGAAAPRPVVMGRRRI